MEKKDRTSNRLKGFDYAQDGAYFITICTADRQCILSQVTLQQNLTTSNVNGTQISVGNNVFGGSKIVLSKYGEIVDRTICRLNDKKGIHIDNYVIMPNHLHLLISINNSSGAPRTSHPTVSDFVGLIKRFANKEIGHNIWQRGFYDHIIRDDTDYVTRYKYIDENPIKWLDDKYHL